MKKLVLFFVFFLQLSFLYYPAFSENKELLPLTEGQSSEIKLSNGCPVQKSVDSSKTSDFTVAADGTTAPCNRKITIAKPLRTADSSNKKWAEYNRAILESDFNRIVKLFYRCADIGDVLCQYLLAEGVSEWLSRTDVEKDRKYDQKFVLKWLRKAFRSNSTLRLVAGVYASYFDNGYRGFPQDDEISQCWFKLTGSPRTTSMKKVRKMANHCEEITLRKYGISL